MKYIAKPIKILGKTIEPKFIAENNETWPYFEYSVVETDIYNGDIIIFVNLRKDLSFDEMTTNIMGITDTVHTLDDAIENIEWYLLEWYLSVNKFDKRKLELAAKKKMIKDIIT